MIFTASQFSMGKKFIEQHKMYGFDVDVEIYSVIIS